MHTKKVVPGILLIALLAGGGWYWSHSNANTGASTSPSQDNRNGKKRGGLGDNRPIPVLADKVKSGDIRVIQTALGTVTPSAVVTVTSRVNGQLTRILFKEGQLVRAGELLAEIDPRPFQATLGQVQGQAMRNQALLRNSQIDLDRYKTLQAQDSIASQQVDAQASLVQQYQGTVQADQALVDNAKLQLSFTRITSPISGRIGLRQVDSGNNITTANAIAVVNTVDPIHVVFTLPEDRISDLVKSFQAARKHGKGLSVEVWDRGNTKLITKGELLSLDNQIDTTSGTVKLKAQFSNGDSTLFPNQFVNVKLLSNTLHDVTIVPNAAIQHGSAGSFVYKITRDKQRATQETFATQKDSGAALPKVVNNQGKWPKDGKQDSGRTSTIKVQNVQLGTIDGDYVEVLNGLNPGDQVVVSGIEKLKDNTKVIVSRPEKSTDGSAIANHKGKHGDNTKNSTTDDNLAENATKKQNHIEWTNKFGANGNADGAHQRPEGGWKRQRAENASDKSTSNAQ